MQFKIFRVSLDNISDDEEILNKFLRSARPLTVRCDFAESKNCYCYSVEYLDAVGGSDNSNPQFSKNKIDYREVLSLEEFSKFRVLREIRKAISEEDKIPPFAIFNDKQMAEIAKGEAVSLTAIKSVKGIGESSIKKYAERVLIMWEANKGKVDDYMGKNDEAFRQSV